MVYSFINVSEADIIVAPTMLLIFEFIFDSFSPNGPTMMILALDYFLELRAVSPKTEAFSLATQTCQKLISFWANDFFPFVQKNPI